MGKVTSGSIFIFFILILLTGVGFTFVDGLPSGSSPTDGDYVTVVSPSQFAAKNSLQLQTFGYVTPTPILALPPTPEPLCGPTDDNGKLVSATCKCIDASVTCNNGQPYDDSGNPLTGEIGTPPVAVNKLCGSFLAPGNGRYCVAKPVIYLYPQYPLLANVTVTSVGEITISDPLYPTGGWKNVLANPDGTLVYDGKQYTELFYETNVTTFTKPESGIFIPINQLAEKLNSLLGQLGLNTSEKQEFISFWLPRLQNLNSPYIFFSLIDKNTKEKIDHVSIFPKPDTMIDFIAYFKPVKEINPDTPTLQLPTAPIREGFVAVEWGGVLDSK